MNTKNADTAVPASDSASAFVRTFLDGQIPPRHADRLANILDSLQKAQTLDDRVDALHALIEWARYSDRALRRLVSTDSSQAFRRFEILVEMCEQSQALRQLISGAVLEVLNETNATNLIGSAGLPSGRGFFAEASDRLIARFLPVPRDDHDLAKVCLRLFRRPREVAGLRLMPGALFARLLNIIVPAGRPDITAAIRDDFADGLRLLATRVRTLGLYDKVRERSHPVRVDQSPFFLLAARADALAASWSQDDLNPALCGECYELIRQCRDEIAEVSRRIESSGVSVDIVYCIDVLERCMARMAQMIAILEASDPDIRAARLHLFFSKLMAVTHQDRSVRHLVRSNTALLSRKIVERTGRSGEHYVAQSSSEYRHIWVAAAGGGIVAGLMAAAKFPVLEAHLALFLEGLALSAIYIAGFLVMQAFGLILATKQPAMFGATLATILRQHDSQDALEAVAGLAANILRSQMVATISNLILVSLTAFAVVSVWAASHGGYLSVEESRYVYESMSPLDSGTIFYSALTGLLLWFASMAGGWLDNWSVYHRIAQGIADHPLRRVFGAKRMARLAGSWSRRAADLGTNITLGILLGMTPIVGQFLGLPLDVRHVTLSTGKFMLACASLGADWYQDGFFWRSLSGVAVMFVFNLGVSFLLALHIAMRSYGLPRRRLLTVIVLFFRRVRDEPFTGPPATQ